MTSLRALVVSVQSTTVEAAEHLVAAYVAEQLLVARLELAEQLRLAAATTTCAAASGRAAAFARDVAASTLRSIADHLSRRRGVS